MFFIVSGNTSSSSIWYEMAYIRSHMGLCSGQRVMQARTVQYSTYTNVNQNKYANTRAHLHFKNTCKLYKHFYTKNKPNLVLN